MNAMALTGQVLMGQSVMVKSSEVGTLSLHIAAVRVVHGTHHCALRSVCQQLRAI